MDSNGIDNVNEIVKLFEFRKVFYLVLSFIVLSFVTNRINIISGIIQKNFTSKRLLILKITTLITFSIYIFGSFFLIYSILSPPKELMIALGGSAAVAIGFALKDLVSSIIAGLILLFDRPFQVGDRVTFGDIYGEINRIGLRAVRLITLDDNLVTIPNSKFVSEAVSSGNAGALDMMVVVDFHLDINADLTKAQKIVEEVVATSRFTYLRKPIIITLNEFMNRDIIGIKLTLKAYVLDVRYEKSFQSDIVKRVTQAFKENNIQRPSL
jgi:small conductance mechanosensitive channel